MPTSGQETHDLSWSQTLRRLNVPPGEVMRANQSSSRKAALLELAASYGVHDSPEPWAVEEIQQRDGGVCIE